MVPGYFEEEAIKCATSALQLSSLPADQCQAHLVLGKAQLTLYQLKAGGRQAAMQLAWPEEPAADPTDDSLKGAGMTKVGPASCIQLLVNLFFFLHASS